MVVRAVFIPNHPWTYRLAVLVVALGLLAGGQSGGALATEQAGLRSASSPDTTRPDARPARYAPEAGRLSRRFGTPADYEADRQNWDAVQDSSGVLYVANSDGVLVYDGRAGGRPGRWRARDGQWRWTPGRLHRLRDREVSTVRVEEGGQTIWMGTERSGLVRYTPDAGSRGTSPAPQIHRVYAAGTDSTVAWGNAGATKALPYDLGGVRIAYGAPTLVRPEAVEYQYRLGGRRADWSNWTRAPEHAYQRLAPGDYTFAVRARTASGDTTRPARYAFTVLPPWYRTGWAYALYVLLALGLGAAAVQWRTRRLRRRQEVLEQTVADRTEEIREKNDQLERQAERLQELDEAKSRFFANVTHEFRTPLTLIRGPIRQMREQIERGAIEVAVPDRADAAVESAAQLTEQLGIVERNVGRLQRLIDQILGLARLDAGMYQLDARPTDLPGETERTARRFEPLAERHGLTLTVEPSGEAPADADPVYVDPEALEHVVDNLFSNAIKFTSEGGTVTVTVEETAEGAALRVRDTGPGISDALSIGLFRTRSSSGKT